MSVSDTANKIQYTLSGTVTSFSFPFKYFNDTDLVVIYTDTDDVSTTLTLNRDYSIYSEDINSGGYINLILDVDLESYFTVAPTSGTLLIKRTLPLESGANFRPAAGFPEQVITDSFDKAIMICQELQEQLDRGLRLPETSSLTGLKLPEPSSRKTLIWNEAETALENSTIDVDGIIEYTDAAAASAAEAAASANEAEIQATAALGYKTTAQAAATAAAVSETNANTYKNNAQTYANNASASASDALSYKTLAESASSSATISKNAAAASASSATISKNLALAAVSSCTISKNLALAVVSSCTISKNAAAGSAAAASASESNALTYKNEAQAAAGTLNVILPVAGDEGKFLQVATPYFNGYDKLTAAAVLTAIGGANKYTLNAINSGGINTATGLANFLSISSNNVNFAVTTPIVLTNYAGTTATLSSTPSACAIANSPVNSTFNIFLGTDGTSEAFTQAIYGQDFYCDFSQASAVDNYGLTSIITIGSPTYTGNKYVSNGVSGLKIKLPYAQWGTNIPWCFILKPSFNTNNTLYTLMQSGNQYAIKLDRTAANKLALYLSNSGSSFDIANGTLGSKADWSTSTEYSIRIRNTGTQYLVDWSTNYDPIAGTGTWTNDITVNSVASLFSSLGDLNFGINYAGTTNPLAGTIDNIGYTFGSPTFAIKNKYRVSKVATLYPITNDIWCDTSGELPTLKKYSGSTWTAYTKVPCGQAVTNASGTLTSVIQPKFVDKKTTNPDNRKPSSIIESYESPDGLTWYKKYSDGWIEQGGYIPSLPNGDYTLTYPISFTKLAKYFNVFAGTDVTADAFYVNFKTIPTEYYAIIRMSSRNYAGGAFWEAKGY